MLATAGRALFAFCGLCVGAAFRCHHSVAFDADGAQLLSNGRALRFKCSQFMTDVEFRSCRPTELVASQYRSHVCPARSVCLAAIPAESIQLVAASALFHAELPLVSNSAFCQFDREDPGRILRTGAYCNQGGDNTGPLDLGLARGVAQLFGAASVADFGASYGKLIKYLLANSSVTKAVGYDGQVNGALGVLWRELIAICACS